MVREFHFAHLMQSFALAYKLPSNGQKFTIP